MKFEDYKKQELVTGILTLAMRISNSQNRDVFVNYSPHVNQLQVEIYEDGWDIDKVIERDVIRHEVYLWGGNAIKELKEIFNELKNYIEKEYKYVEEII